MKSDDGLSKTELNDRGTITVRETDHWFVEIVRMIYSWRIVLTPKSCPNTYDAGWCYFGTDRETFARCWRAAEQFDPETQADPEGYNKRLFAPRIIGAS